MAIISESWDNVLRNQLNQPYILKIQQRIANDLKAGLVVCPKMVEVFNAYKAIPFENVRVVILGQDPYYIPHTSDGLAFSANQMTPALETIFKEIKGCTGMIRTETNLSDWSKQGVFLLNSILTTVRGKPLAHQNIGWERLTNYTLAALNAGNQKLVVMLWGSYAINLGTKYFDGAKHFILKAPHPNADNYASNLHTFRGSNHFSSCNEWMQSHNFKQINWGDPI